MNKEDGEKKCAEELTRRNYHKGLITGCMIGTVSTAPVLLNFGAQPKAAIGYVVTQTVIVGGLGYAFSLLQRCRVARRTGSTVDPSP